MTEIDDTFYLTTLDQVHTLADPLRVRILDRLRHEPMTVKMLGTELGEAPAKVHYHVRELERIGVIRLVETREKGGVLEKYYRAIAHNYSILKDLLYNSQPNELNAIVQEYFQVVQRGLTAALAQYHEHPDRHLPISISNGAIWATEEEFRALLGRISELVESYQAPRHLESEQEWTLDVIGHSAAPEPDQKPVAPSPDPGKIHRSYRFGATGLDRKELDGVVAHGSQLDLTVVGVCSFASDITPELADLAIARIHIYGVLHASPDVRAVLLSKGGENQPNATA